MPIKNQETKAENWSQANILELVRKLRNDLIKDFLDERNLISYFETNFNRRELNSTKIEFIKKELKELLISPVDTVHYEPLIRQIGESDSASLEEGNERLFYFEIERVLKKFNY